MTMRPLVPVVAVVLGVGACQRAPVASDAHGTRPDSAGISLSPNVAADTAASDAPEPGDAASAATAVEYYGATSLSHIADSLARTPRTGYVLRNHPTFQTIVLRRSASGVPEIHDRWTDVMIFQSGRATLLLGGRATGTQLTSAGEHRGGTIAGGRSQSVAAGDVLVIPAGTPHQVWVTRGDSIRYVTVKVPGGTG